jgi:hypothetical protein
LRSCIGEASDGAARLGVELLPGELFQPTMDQVLNSLRVLAPNSGPRGESDEREGDDRGGLFAKARW